ncbi:hypothetical protein [Blastococcus sp. SYSU DS0616]
MVVIVIIAPLVSRLGLGRTLGASLFVAASGLVVLAVAEGGTSYAGLALGLVIVGLGFGVTFTTATDAVLGAVPPQRSGAASAISEMSYELGIALGIALLGTLHTIVYRAFLPDLSGLTASARDAVSESLAFGTSALMNGGDNRLLTAAQDAFSHSMQITSVIAAVLLVVAGAVAWKVVPASQTQLTDDS